MTPAKPDRRTLTPLQKRGVYVNYDCRCANFARCGTVFRGVKSVFCFDHTHALCLGGGNEDENFRPLCRDCTMAKNRADARALEKARLLEAERLAQPQTIGRLKPAACAAGAGEARPARHRWPRRPFPSRPFPSRQEMRA